MNTAHPTPTCLSSGSLLVQFGIIDQMINFQIFQTKPLLIISLDYALTNRNSGRGHHWGQSAKCRKQLELLVSATQGLQDPFTHPVALIVTRVLGPGQRKWDADSVGRGSAKELIDSLVACGFFVDDSPRWVSECIFTQDASRRKIGPKTEVAIYGRITTSDV